MSDRIIVGTINADGTIQYGSNFSVTRTTEGHYNVSFRPGFSQINGASVTQVYNDGDTRDNAVIIKLNATDLYLKVGDKTAARRIGASRSWPRATATSPQQRTDLFSSSFNAWYRPAQAGWYPVICTPRKRPSHERESGGPDGLIVEVRVFQPPIHRRPGLNDLANFGLLQSRNPLYGWPSSKTGSKRKL
ncbi:hypothetical protein [Paraburkholderia jirisanensis]